MRLECRTDRRGNPFELPKKQLTHDGHFELWRKGHAYGNARLEAVRTHLPAIIKRFDQDATTTQPAEANLSTFRFIRYRNFQSKLHLRSLTSARTRWVKNESQRVQNRQENSCTRLRAIAMQPHAEAHRLGASNDGDRSSSHSGLVMYFEQYEATSSTVLGNSNFEPPCHLNHNFAA